MNIELLITQKRFAVVFDEPVLNTKYFGTHDEALAYVDGVRETVGSVMDSQPELAYGLHALEWRKYGGSARVSGGEANVE